MEVSPRSFEIVRWVILKLMLYYKFIVVNFFNLVRAAALGVITGVSFGT